MSESLIVIKNTEQKKKYTRQLLRDLAALEYMLNNDLIEKGKIRIGAEQELDFVDKNFNPSAIGVEVLDELNKDYLTTEYARFNLEINAEPLELKDHAFSSLKKSLLDKLKTVQEAAQKRDSDIILTGILPTLKRRHLTLENLTPSPRYKTMLEIVNQSRGRNYEFHIKGVDELITRENPTIFGGSFTSFQVHLQVEPETVVPLYNWAQAIAGPFLAASVNSPIFLKKRLWQETRIALFQQTSDTRKPYENFKEENARVLLGNDWVEESILEIFQEDIAQFTMFVASDKEEDSLEKIKSGEVPSLDALNFHNGTVYRWNRVCYGVTHGKPHLRIENRIMPSGPTLEDQIANTAFWIGMMRGMPEKYHNISSRMSFDRAKANFYKGARYGLNVKFDWVDGSSITAKELILEELLPIARKGLKNSNISEDEINQYLQIIEDRVTSEVTGAKWMLDNFNSIKKKTSSDEASANIVAATIKRQLEDLPVHRWGPVEKSEAGIRSANSWTIEQIMTKDLYTVQPDDLIDMASNIMKWKNIRHLPVENSNGRLVGLVTQKSLFNLYTAKEDTSELLVRDAMITEMVTVSPDDLIVNAIQLMLDFRLTCLPVLDNNQIAGIVTEHDFVQFSKRLFQKMK